MTQGTEKKRPDRPLRSPVVDIFETDKGVTFQFELPGVAGEDVDIHVEGDTLAVCSRADIAEEGKRDIVFREFERANFSREFVLARDLDKEKIEAKWGSGLLTLVVPKAEAAKPRKIEIKGS